MAEFMLRGVEECNTSTPWAGAGAQRSGAESRGLSGAATSAAGPKPSMELLPLSRPADFPRLLPSERDRLFRQAVETLHRLFCDCADWRTHLQIPCGETAGTTGTGGGVGDEECVRALEELAGEGATPAGER